MKKNLLSSLVMMAVFSGCGGDSSCCDSNIKTNAVGIPPVATITGIDTPAILALGQSITVSGITSSDRDGNVVNYQWKLDGSNVSTEQSPTFTFNTAGEHELCLVVTDNDNQKSANVECKAITVLGDNDTIPTLPKAVIDLSDDSNLTDYSTHTFSCANSYDSDKLGSGDEIVSCDWEVISYKKVNDEYVPYKNCSDDVMDGKEIYICPQAYKIVAKLKVTDNDGQVASTTKEYILK